MIRVDDPSTSRVTIATAAGITFGSPHPNSSGHRAMEFDLTEASGDGMVWELTVRYYVPPATNAPDTTTSTGIPADFWQASGASTTAPVYVDKDDSPITNTAGDPLEGLERETNEFTLTLTKFYDGAANYAWSALAKACSNTVNNASWNGSNPRKWKVQFRSANRKPITSSSDGETKYYWETIWEFRYREESWDYEPWDIGFNQLVDSTGGPSQSGTTRAAVLGADKKPVKQPVALSHGVAKQAGQPPDKLSFKVYKESDFSQFGTPS